MTKQPKQIYEFGSFRLDAAERMLLRDGVPVPLTPKAFDTLLVLVENSGHLLDKDDLMKTVWPDAFVEEGGLTRNISSLRKALANDSGEEHYIETVPKRGYRFTASVRELKDGVGAPMTVESHSRARIVVVEEIGGDKEAPLARLAFGETAARRERRVSRTVLFAALASLALAVALASVIYLRRGQPLTERDTVLLADFDNRTGDEVFDETLKQALAVQLGQSPFLNIFSDDRVRETLRYMGKSPDERVTKDLAREICARQGIKGMLTGSIATLGSHYVITLEALSAETGDSITREQVEADSKEQVLQVFGKAASKLRERLGESLSSIQKFDAPIEQGTTSSLEALKAFSLGSEQARSGKFLEAIPLYKRAIELDPNFALAYIRLSAAYRSLGQAALGQADLAAECSRKAFELRDRVSEREKLNISFRYYYDVTFELDKAIEVLELLKLAYPRDTNSRNNLSVVYMGLGQYEKVIEESSEAQRLNPNSAPTYVNWAFALIRLNRFDEAKAVVEQALAKKFDNPIYHRGLYWIAFFQGDGAAMQQQIAWHTGKPVEYEGLALQAQVAAFSGQLRGARDFTHRAIDSAQRRNLKEVASTYATESAVREALFGNCQQSRERVADAFALARSKFSRTACAYALALCGEARQAQTLIDELISQYPKDILLNRTQAPLIKAAIELHRDNAARAVEILQTARENEMGVWASSWPVYLRGLAYLRLRAGKEAMIEFQRMVDSKALIATYPSYALLYPLARLGLARGARLTGDTTTSRGAYEDFFALWKDADPDIPILQEARREYAKLK